MTDAEKRMMLAFLRGQQPIPKSLRIDLANILERMWYPASTGRRGQQQWTSWETGNHNLRAWAYRAEVRREQAAMMECGEGHRRDIAEEMVAERCGISRRALQERMKYLPYDK